MGKTTVNMIGIFWAEFQPYTMTLYMQLYQPFYGCKPSIIHTHLNKWNKEQGNEFYQPMVNAYENYISDLSDTT